MRLHASLDFGGGKRPIPVGEIAWSADRQRAVVEWVPDFAARNLSLSPLLVRDWTAPYSVSNPAAFSGLPAVFCDSVPDGWGRYLMDHEIDRRGLSGPLPLAYLTLVGRHGMGALCYEPADEEAQRVTSQLLEFFSAAADRLESIDDSTLESLRAISGGAQGARPKFMALFNPITGGLRDYRDAVAGGDREVLVKRAAPDDTPSAVAIEAGYAKAALAAGITMMPSQMIQSEAGEQFFLSDRFDRDQGARLHTQTVAALLEIDFRRGQASYEGLFEIARHLYGDDRASEQIYRRMLFNVGAVNCDDHAKNHAFLMDADGNWHLAPAYDLTFSPGVRGYHASSISDDQPEPSPKALLDLGVRFGITGIEARRIASEVADVLSELPRFLKQAAVPTRSAAVISEASKKAMKTLPIGRSKTRDLG